MKPYKHFPWDSMFIDPDERAAAFQPKDPPEQSAADPDPYAHIPVRQLTVAQTLNFQDNLDYVHDWTAREMLGLLIDQVSLIDVDFDYLDHWRKNYQQPPEE